MSQRYFQELHNTAATMRSDAERVPMRQYVKMLTAKSKRKALSYLQEFLDEVFSAEGACRFFRTFLLRFAFDSNGSGEDGFYNAAWIPALVPVETRRYR